MKLKLGSSRFGAWPRGAPTRSPPGFEGKRWGHRWTRHVSLGRAGNARRLQLERAPRDDLIRSLKAVASAAPWLLEF